MLRSPQKLVPGDKVAIISPSLGGPAFGPEVHEQAMERVRQKLNLEPVEYPTTREKDASAEAKAADLNSAFANPEIKAIMATIGGWNLIEVLPHLDFQLIRSNPKIFLGYSDNTNLHNYFFHAGFQSYYGGSTMVQIGPGPAVENYHLDYLKRVLFDGGEVELTLPDTYEDHGFDWADPRALKEFGRRLDFPQPIWGGAKTSTTGMAWGGCLEVLGRLAVADLLPSNDDLDGAILLFESSDPQISDERLISWLLGYGERGLLQRANGVLFGFSPTEDFGFTLPEEEKQRIHEHRAQTVIEIVSKYNPEIPICYGYPFGHTRPQLILPIGGAVSMDGDTKKVKASYS